MPVLARKITRAKWDPRAELAQSEIGADAVTGDLKTSSNALSVWRCESSDKEHLQRAVLALAAAADRPDRVDLVYLDEQALSMIGLSTRNTMGDTPVETLREHHVDIENSIWVD